MIMINYVKFSHKPMKELVLLIHIYVCIYLFMYLFICTVYKHMSHMSCWFQYFMQKKILFYAKNSSGVSSVEFVFQEEEQKYNQKKQRQAPFGFQTHLTLEREKRTYILLFRDCLLFCD